MADAVSTHIMHEAADQLTVKLTNVSDGTGESAVLKVDVSALTPAASRVEIEKIIWTTSGMSAQLLWDASTDVPAWICGTDSSGCVDFTQFAPGRLKNNAGAGISGDLLLTTSGHTSGDSYSIVLVMRKIP